MYKVLLADDEILDLEGMRIFVPWKELGLEVVGAVNNGFAAYEVINKEQIDILVTDVRMPNMSGLELASKAIEKQRDLRIIFVSGHQDFNYLKQAMKLNAHGYVLKPMDDKELIESLTKVRQDLDLRKKRRETEETYKQMVPIVKNEYLLQLLLEVPNERSASGLLDKEFRMDSLSWPIRVAVLEIDDYSWNLNPYADGERRVLLDQFYGLLSSLLGECGVEHVCKISKQRTALLLGESAGLEAIRRLPERIREQFPFTVTIGLGLSCAGLTELNISYGKAVQALDYKMFHGKGKLITYDEDETEMLHQKKHTKNGKLVKDIMESVRDRLHENISLRDVASRFSFSPNYLGHLFRGETGQNFSDYIIALRMEKAQEMLRNSNLKIYEVANQVGYRYLPYFSRHFKEITGMAPLEYRRKH
ncbi:response regulator [Cohnella sp.]|uniref:response regulator n=1 Tax=Cohnella sp. TaxID=1883426 RepID=UPI003564E60C